MKKMFWGILLILAGIILGLNALNVTNINLFFDGWWTLFIIVPSIYGLLKGEYKNANIIGLLLGLLLLFTVQGIINFNIIWKLFIPITLIIIGISFILKNLISSKEINTKMSTDEHFATFSSQNLNFDEEKFEGTNLSVVFGEINLDLRKSIIKSDVVINTSSVFGGTEIHLPSNVKLKVNSTPIFGGVTNKFWCG